MNDQLNDLKKKEADLQASITEKASLDGQKTQLLKAVKDRFDVDTLAAVHQLIEKKNAELIDYETTIEKLNDKIEAAMIKVKGT